MVKKADDDDGPLVDPEYAKPGDRVFAVVTPGCEPIYLIGYGVYEGDFELGSGSGYMNPRIKLDNGETVWGAECWWGPASIMEQVEESHFVHVTIKRDKRGLASFIKPDGTEV